MLFFLRFPLDEIPYWSERYDYTDDTLLQNEVIPFMHRERYLSKPLLLTLARWKSPRIVPQCDSNDHEFIREVTYAALNATTERMRIEVLTLLCGVGWPMASVILHFGYENQYPILDFRALWSLGVDVPKRYTFQFWEEYTHFTRELACKAGVSMRELDRALWQYSKEKQAPA